MKKLLAFAIVVALIACSGKTEKTGQEAKDNVTKEALATGEEATDSPAEDLDQVVAKFLNENPYYKLEDGKAVEDWYQKLYTLLGEKPEYAEALRLTKLLSDYLDDRSDAFHKWDSQVGQPDEEFSPISYNFEHIPLEREWEEKFISLVHNNPTMLDYPAALLEAVAGYKSLTSADHRLRIYYWITNRGGESNHNTCKFFQFRTEAGKVHVPMYSKLTGAKATPAMKDDNNHPLNNEMPWEWCTWPDTLYILDTDKGRVYMEKATREPFRFYVLEELTAKSISGDKLIDYPLFVTKGKKSAKIESAAGCVGENEKPSDKGLETGIKYDEKTGVITVDLYKEREKFSQEKGWFIKTGTNTYIFDGNVFKLK